MNMVNLFLNMHVLTTLLKRCRPTSEHALRDIWHLRMLDLLHPTICKSLRIHNMHNLHAPVGALVRVPAVLRHGKLALLTSASDTAGELR